MGCLSDTDATTSDGSNSVHDEEVGDCCGLDDDEDDDQPLCAKIKNCFSKRCLRRMVSSALKKLGKWLLEVEMGFVWGVAGLSIFIFVFAAIWYIDPALLTLVLQFRQASCTAVKSAFLIGISNCSWTSCRVGCTREIYKCWQIQVDFEFVADAPVYRPPWASISDFDRGGVHNADYTDEEKSPPENRARLYPNVRGCGYPPELNCEAFFESFGKLNNDPFTCWVSTMDTSIAMTELDLERAKSEVIFSLIPLLIFIVFVLYAFCRHGVFSVCNPLKVCPRMAGSNSDIPTMTPKQLLAYRREMAAKNNADIANKDEAAGSSSTPNRDRPPETESSNNAQPLQHIVHTSTILEDKDEEAREAATTQASSSSSKPSSAKESSSSAAEVAKATESLNTSRRSSQKSTHVRSRNRKRRKRSGEVLTDSSQSDDPMMPALKASDTNDELIKLEQELYPLQPITSLRHQALGDVVQEVPGLKGRKDSFTDSFSGLFDDNDDKADTKTVIDELFAARKAGKSSKKRSALEDDVLNLSDISLGSARVKKDPGVDKRIFQPDYFGSRAPQPGGSSDKNCPDSLDDLLSTTSSFFDSPQRLKAGSSKRSARPVKSASSSFSAWADDSTTGSDHFPLKESSRKKHY